jgi:hypothetical protein
MSTLEKLTLTKLGYDHHVAVWWRKRMRTISRWDNVCIYAIEHYGLPGCRYITDISADRMIWSFKDPRDALMFKLRWSEVVC